MVACDEYLVFIRKSYKPIEEVESFFLCALFCRMYDSFLPLGIIFYQLYKTNSPVTSLVITAIGRNGVMLFEVIVGIEY